MTDLLEKAIAKIKDLPDHRQNMAAEILLDFANDEAGTYILSPDERAEVQAGIAELDRGEAIGEAEMIKFWRQTGVL